MRLAPFMAYSLSKILPLILLPLGLTLILLVVGLVGRWAGSLWRDPTQWLPSAGALYNSSRALRELLGRLVYRFW